MVVALAHDAGPPPAADPHLYHRLAAGRADQDLRLGLAHAGRCELHRVRRLLPGRLLVDGPRAAAEQGPVHLPDDSVVTGRAMPADFPAWDRVYAFWRRLAGPGLDPRTPRPAARQGPAVPPCSASAFCLGPWPGSSPGDCCPRQGAAGRRPCIYRLTGLLEFGSGQGSVRRPRHSPWRARHNALSTGTASLVVTVTRRRRCQ